jgi:hypothetical protein
MHRDMTSRFVRDGGNVAPTTSEANTMKRAPAPWDALVDLCHTVVSSLIGHLTGGVGREHPFIWGGELVWVWLLDVRTRMREASKPRSVIAPFDAGETDV